MIHNYSYPEEFKDLIKKITKKTNVDLLELDGIGKQLDVNDFSRKFFSKSTTTTADISVDANSNVEDVTILQYSSELAKPIQRLNSYFLLWKYARALFSTEFAEEALTSQLNKDIYINDAHNLQAAYCFNFSCMDVVFRGLPFTSKVKSEPAKNLSSFMGQMINFITYAGNNIAGACGVADLLVSASWYVDKLYKENPNIPKKFLDKQVAQEIQSFIYSVNQPFRGGIQSFFTNVSIFDSAFLDKICKEYKFPDGANPNKETIQKLQDIYIDTMNDILSKSPATFPVTTAAFGVDKDKKILDKEFLKKISQTNIKYGFMNIFAGETSTFSSCCRLRNNAKHEYFNSYGSGSTKIGSVGVVTVNLPRLAFLAKNREDFLERVQKTVELASRINHVKRFLIKKRINGGHYPLYSLGFMDLNRQYSTCGLVGINEAVEILGFNILEKEGQELVTDMLDIANQVNVIQEKKFKYPHNIEQTPSETSSIKLATADKLLSYNDKYSIYSNQFIPLTTEADFLDRIKLTGMFDKHMTGGAICHLNIADEITDKEFMSKLIETAISNGVVYFAINYNLQECKNKHITIGKNDKCPKCGKEITDNYVRVVGFLVNTKNFHKTRREQDYPNRQFYSNISL